MTESFYTLARWNVKPGQETEFASAWKALSAAFRKLPRPPKGEGLLLQSMRDSTLHYSFGPWESSEDIVAMREDTDAIEAIMRVKECCEDAEPGGFRVIARG